VTAVTARQTQEVRPAQGQVQGPIGPHLPDPGVAARPAARMAANSRCKTPRPLRCAST